jgi:sulfofructose kinase
MLPTARSKSSKNKPFLAVGVGLCTLDYICVVDKFPGSDQKLDALVASRQGGGPVSTALCAISHFGEKVSFIGKAGNDSEGQTIRAEMERFGVDTSGMVFDPYSRTARAFIWVDSDKAARTVVLDRTEIADLDPTELNVKLLKSCRYLHLDGREVKASFHAAKIAKDAGAEIVLDVGSVRENVKDLLTLVDHLVVSHKFAGIFTGQDEPGKAAMRLLEMDLETVVVTMGHRGSVYATEGDFGQMDAFDVETVDTTGAGDVFHGAYIYGLAKDWDLRDIVEFASAAAAMKCVRIGGRKGIPKVDEVVQFMEVRKGRL